MSWVGEDVYIVMGILCREVYIYGQSKRRKCQCYIRSISDVFKLLCQVPVLAQSCTCHL